MPNTLEATSKSVSLSDETSEFEKILSERDIISLHRIRPPDYINANSNTTIHNKAPAPASTTALYVKHGELLLLSIQNCQAFFVSLISFIVLRLLPQIIRILPVIINYYIIFCLFFSTAIFSTVSNNALGKVSDGDNVNYKQINRLTPAVSVIDEDFVQQMLKYGSKMPRILESQELAFISYNFSNPISVLYDISPNKNSWIFITPCTHYNYSVTISALNSSDITPKISNRITDDYKDKYKNWYKRVRIVHMEGAEGMGQILRVSNWKRQNMHVQGLSQGNMMLRIQTNINSPAVFMIRQYSGKIDAFYPRIPPDPFVRVCSISDNPNRPALKIYVSPAFNADIYCFIFNVKINLPNLCSANIYIQNFSQILTKEQVTIRHSSIFEDFQHKVRRTTGSVEIKCSKFNNIKLELDIKFKRNPMFINVFAINNASKFSDAYRPIQYSWPKQLPVMRARSGSRSRNRAVSKCQRMHNNKEKHQTGGKNHRRLQMGLKQHMWLYGNENIRITVPARPARLLFQACSLPLRQTLSIYPQHQETPVCVEPGRNWAKLICDNIEPGEYYMRFEISGRSTTRDAIGQLYLLPSALQPFPHLDCTHVPNNFMWSVSIIRKMRPEDATGSGVFTITATLQSVPSKSAVTYYFYIMDVDHNRTLNDSETEFEALSRISNAIKTEINYCRLTQRANYTLRATHRVTVPASGCQYKPENNSVTRSGIKKDTGENDINTLQQSDGISKTISTIKTDIPAKLSGNGTFALLVYYTRKFDTRLEFAQFYSSLIFSRNSQEGMI